MENVTILYDRDIIIDRFHEFLFLICDRVFEIRLKLFRGSKCERPNYGISSLEFNGTRHKIRNGEPDKPVASRAAVIF